MRTSLAILLFAATAAVAQDRDFSKVEVKATKVAGTVYMLTGAGGNIGVSAGSDGIIVVDDQFAPLAPKIRAALKEIADKPIKFIINTHYHGDHTGGNEVFGKDAPIVAQDAVRKRLVTGGKVFGRDTPPAPHDALPVLTFDRNVTLWENGEEMRVFFVSPGHTDGDAIVWFKTSNVVHMGDDFFTGGYPIVDVDAGGTIEGMIKTVDTVLAMMPDDVKVIPGHGALADKKALKDYVEMLRASSAAVKKAIAEGQTVEQMKTNGVLKPWEAWSKGFVNDDRYLGQLMKEFKR